MGTDAVSLDIESVAREALSAKAGNRAARNTLFHTFRPAVARFFARYARRAHESAAWDMEDLHQESFLVFVEVLDAWPGSGDFVAYFYAVFPKRLATAVRRLDGSQPWIRYGISSEGTDDPSQRLDSRAMLNDFVALLSPPERQILALHAWESLALPDVARHAGLSLDDTRRHWRRIRRKARAFSSNQAPPGH
jgi:RNA polymerase sigma factor (sigma-70 family)